MYLQRAKHLDLMVIFLQYHLIPLANIILRDLLLFILNRLLTIYVLSWLNSRSAQGATAVDVMAIGGKNANSSLFLRNVISSRARCVKHELSRRVPIILRLDVLPPSILYAPYQIIWRILHKKRNHRIKILLRILWSIFSLKIIMSSHNINSKRIPKTMQRILIIYPEYIWLFLQRLQYT
jgi:hypothetical protein